MRIIEITALSNGAHRNQTTNSMIHVPEGWAVIPDSIAIPETFPFVDIEVDGQTVTTVTSGTIPEPEPEPEPEPTAEERISALETENRLLNQQITALTDQNDFQEELIVELASIVYA